MRTLHPLIKISACGLAILLALAGLVYSFEPPAKQETYKDWL